MNCPTCDGALRVPFQDSDEQHVPAPTGAVPQPMFEHSDFDAFLQGDVNAPVVAAPPASAPAAPIPGTVWNRQAANMVDVEPGCTAPTAPPPGIMLSNGLATLLTIGVIFLMAMSFSLGLLVGRAP